MKRKPPRSRSNSNELCDICGDVGFDEVLATCIICNTAREHTYCMRVYPNDNTKNWTCESCLSSNVVLPEACLKKENVVVSFSACKRTGEQEVEDLRRANIKYAFSKQKKLDTGAFECHFEKLWGSFSEDKRTSFTYLDCLWFNMYKRQPFKAKVLTWIKKKHIFSKKYVLVPIIGWGHWSLLIFCHFGESLQSKTRTPCMLLLDSLQMANPRQVEPDIRKFVLDIYEAEGRPENKDFIYRIPLLVPKVPQQAGNEECGSFVLYFSKLFVEGAPEDFRVEDYPYFMNENWFTPKGLESFCEKLGTLNGLPLKARRTSGRLAILKRKT